MRIFHITAIAAAMALLPLHAYAREDGGKEDGAFLEQLQQRDSVLIGDQLRYGIRINSLPEGTRMVLPEWSDPFVDKVEMLTGWRTDTLRTRKAKKGKPALLDLEAAVTLTSFDEGLYELPPISVQLIYEDGVVDSRDCESMFLDVTTMPVDTSSFEVHDIKGQIRYPVTFREVLPWLAGGIGIGALIAGLVWLAVRLVRRRKGEDGRPRDPAHIVALRKLDALRGESLWEAEKQKLFYSGVTDALREYIDARYDVSAMEMTTAEIFDGLKDREISPDLYNQLQELFSRSDFVKFAKHVATREENASAVPLAVRFVTETYQREIEGESNQKMEK